jgi:hypothetical protein
MILLAILLLLEELTGEELIAISLMLMLIQEERRGLGSLIRIVMAFLGLMERERAIKRSSALSPRGLELLSLETLPVLISRFPRNTSMPR